MQRPLKSGRLTDLIRCVRGMFRCEPSLQPLCNLNRQCHNAGRQIGHSRHASNAVGIRGRAYGPFSFLLVMNTRPSGDILNFVNLT